MPRNETRMARLEQRISSTSPLDQLSADEVDLGIAMLKIAIATARGNPIDTAWTRAVSEAPEAMLTHVRTVSTDASRYLGLDRGMSL